MPSNTPNLGLYKKDPATDGNDYFDVDLMLNENWDKIDQEHARNDIATEVLTQGTNTITSDRQTNLSFIEMYGNTENLVNVSNPFIKIVDGSGNTLSSVTVNTELATNEKVTYTEESQTWIKTLSDGTTQTVTVTEVNTLELVQGDNIVEIGDDNSLLNKVVVKYSKSIRKDVDENKEGIKTLEQTVNTHLAETVTIKLYEEILTTDTASVIISNLPQTFKDIRCVLTGRGTSSSANAGVHLQLNGDINANYHYEFARISGTTSPTLYEGIATNQMMLGFIPAANVDTYAAGTVDFTIYDYARTTWEKHLFFNNAMRQGTVSGSIFAISGSGFWRSTNAITSLTLRPLSGSFKAGTVISVYGEVKR